NKLEGIKFVLANDIALTNDWIPIGVKNKNATGCYFKGTFDGNGRTISGLQITTEGEYCGLFGYINGGTVKNLTVEGSVIGTSSCGGIAGMAAYSCVIDNCISKVEVISDSGTSVGGIVGNATSATIQNCINYGNVSGVNTVGGIAGSTSSTKIYNCANFGTIEGNANVGGLCGVCPTEMKNCYNAGTITSSSEAGAGSVCGNSGTSGPFKNVFWFSDTYGKAFSSGATVDGVTEIANTEDAANSLRSDLNNGIIASDVLNSMPGNPYLIWVNNYTLNGITYPTTVPGR
ncbi:MAG: hypothetical protein II684_05910, partial [Treponema sp.]|nr:hypothetical protein [Treponema sp.]